MHEMINRLRAARVCALSSLAFSSAGEFAACQNEFCLEDEGLAKRAEYRWE